MDIADEEDLIEAVSAAFAKASGGSSGTWRVLGKQLLRASGSCKGWKDFSDEATKFSSGFRKLPDCELESLFHQISTKRKELESERSTVAWSREGGDAFDREFYGVDDEQKGFWGDESKWKEKEARLERLGEQRKSLAARARQDAYNRDQSAWEENLMFRSGVKSGRRFDTEDLNEMEERVHVVVHNIRPAFLRQDDQIFSLDHQGGADVVRDEASEMAKVAMRGCPSVQRIRQQNVRTKMTHKFWNLGGSRIGKAMGVSREDEEGEFGQSEDVKAEHGLSKLAEQVKASSGQQQKLSSREEIRRVRESLPVYQVRDELLSVIRSHQVIVIVGETGSGKTTQLTQYLREDGYTRSHGGRPLLIGCTQPRRVAAMSVAKRVADEVGCEIGTQVGYSIRFEDCTSETTEIKYMTDGVLMRETLSSPDLDKYSCIVMDEAHERSLFTDVLFGILKQVVVRRLDFKLIVTSATMDAEKFSNFFGGAATFHIPGRTFKVDTYFSKSQVTDYVEAAAKKALEIHLSNPPGDILIFMTGQEDITATCQLIAEKIESLGDGVPELLLLPMYSQLPSDLQSKIFDKPNPGQRKCIVSTNIAETSLTVDGIKYVIDSGYCKIKVFNPRVGMDSLRVTPVSQANANQRSGRAGRTSEGFCWRMYTQNQFVRDLLPAQVPEIQRTNLGNVVLLLKSLGVRDLLSFDFMDPPPHDNIVNSMYQLWVLGALDGRGDLTKLGKRMGKYPLDPPLSKMLLTAEELDCVDDTLTVVSMLSVPEVFYRPPERAEESDQARERFFVPESDHLTLVNVYNQVSKHKFSAAWCAKYFVHVKALIKARDVREQLESIVHTAKRDQDEEEGLGSRAPNGQQRLPRSQTVSWTLVRKAICSSYFIHAARLKNITQYVNLLNGTPANLHPSSAICGIGETPDYVVYHELVLTSKEYMRTVTAIDPQWLAELGPMFFSIKGAEESEIKHELALRQEKVSTSSSSNSTATQSSKRDRPQTAKAIIGSTVQHQKKKKKRRGL